MTNRAELFDDFGDPIIRFAPNQPLPNGWRVVQLDSGHYMGTDGNRETAITVNRFHARRWCWNIFNSATDRKERT